MDNLPFHHILVIQDEKSRQIVSLEETIYSIGRDATNAIVIDDRQVSRFHATLMREEDTANPLQTIYKVIDGDLEGNISTNGVVVNGKPSLSHILKHGDVIHFGEKVKALYYILSDPSMISLFENNEQIGELDELENETAEQEAVMNEKDYKTTLNFEKNLEQMSQAELIRLASFPELSPNPIIEMNWLGEITYLNPAASLKFKGINQLGGEHPILSGLTNNCQSKRGNLFVREVQIGLEVFEQYVHYLSENQLIRSYIFNFTKRKQVEAALRESEQSYRSSEQKLSEQGKRDHLTGLLNLYFIKEHWQLIFSNAEKYKRQMGLILLDIQRFAETNRLFGKTIADYCLAEIGKRLKICEEYGAIAVRSQEDNFAILLPTLNNFNDAGKLAQLLLDNLRQPIHVHLEDSQPTVQYPEEIKLNFSLGIGIYPTDAQDFDNLWRNTETALQRSQEIGSNNYQFYSASMTSRVNRQLRLESLLQEAISEQGLYLAYQPIVNIQSGMITGMEALLGWRDFELQKVPPEILIALAEEMDIINPIGEWLLKAACLQNYLWQQNGITCPPISVNLSSKQLQTPNLAPTIARILQSTKLEPHWLELEITSEAIVENSETVFKILRDILQMGVQISLDGFGGSYCSLTFLKKFPFHTLKIDQSFIKELEDNPKDTSIISAIVSLGQSFNMRVVAKGVEKIQQLKLLRKLECNEIQGYLFSEPLTADDATKVLKTGNVNYLIP